MDISEKSRGRTAQRPAKKLPCSRRRICFSASFFAWFRTHFRYDIHAILEPQNEKRRSWILGNLDIPKWRCETSDGHNLCPQIMSLPCGNVLINGRFSVFFFTIVFPIFEMSIIHFASRTRYICAETTVHISDDSCDCFYVFFDALFDGRHFLRSFGEPFSGCIRRDFGIRK